MKKVIGRYAPSPTGDLHLGNLRTALLCWLQARLLEGEFLIRMEDLDRPRVVPGSADQILRDLEWLGLDWDGGVVYQNQRHELYQMAIEQLNDQELLYECFCSRKEIQQVVSAPHSQIRVYPKICSKLSPANRSKKRLKKLPALRFRVANEIITFDDELCARQQQNLETECGDFVLKRADGLFAYQLAVVVDDLEQCVTHVMRGRDLLDSTARQIALAGRLAETQGQPLIKYGHAPLFLDEHGRRMAKRDGSDSIRYWKVQGKDASELVAYLGNTIGLTSAQSISANELLESLTYQQFIGHLVKCNKM